MLKKIIRPISFLLACTMTLSLTACSSAGEGLSSDVEIIYEYVSANKNSSEETDSKKNSTVSEENNTTSNVSKDSNASNTSKGNDASSNNSKDNNTSSDVSGKDGAVDPEKYKGTTVRFATWRDPGVNEDGDVISSFEKKYDITVKVDLINEADYINEISGRIASGNSPDVFVAVNTFPAALSCLQPLEVTKVDFSDPIWEQTVLKDSTINGKQYLCNTVGSYWNAALAVFYNKRILNKAGLYTPEEYAKQGKWNWDTFEVLMRKVKESGGGYYGAALSYSESLATIGSSVYQYKNGEFSNGLDTKLINASKRLSEWYNEGLCTWGNYAFGVDKAAFCISDTFGMRRTGYFANASWEDIGVYYAPDYDDKNKACYSSIFRGYGIIKGAKNPVGAGIFLRHYLDVDNYNLDKSFINDQAQKFFFEITSGDMESKTYYFPSRVLSNAVGMDITIFDTIIKGSPEQVTAQINAQKNAVDSAVKNLNNYLKQ